MNLIDHNQKLPAGLVDGGTEFFLHSGDVKCTHKGNVYSFNEFPEEVVEVIEREMLAHPKALQALADWNITDQHEQVKQFIACRFGGFDGNPDVDSQGNVLPAEYVNCGRRGECPYEGKLCCSIQVTNGFLTKREIEVLKEIGLGMLDKEICNTLGITQDTLRNHKDNISAKAGLERKTALAILAYKLNLI